MSILEVKNLRTYYSTVSGTLKAVDGITFSLSKGETLGLAGESACGKSTAAMSIIKLVSPPGKIVGGEILLNGVDLVRKSDSYLRENIRWKRISVVFQGTSNSLNPLFRIRDQIVEGILAHEKTTKNDAEKRSEEALALTGIARSRGNNYPHEFSGGMNQRAALAMALACRPDIMLADEPTTGLDVMMQAQILQFIKVIQKELGLGIIWITHDISVLTEVCDKVAFMYAGKFVEYGSVASIFKNPLHPYAQLLINAFPNIRGPKIRMKPIEGSPPNLINPPSGCRFHPRCPYVFDRCSKTTPELIEVERGHYAACYLCGKST